MFRSEDMCYNQILFAKESMWDTMNYLCFSEKIMFAKKNNFQNYIQKNSLSSYASRMVKRTEELLVTLQNIEDQLIKFKLPLHDYKKNAKKYLLEIDLHCKKNGIKEQKIFEQIEKHIKEKFEILKKHTDNYYELISQRKFQLEKIAALQQIDNLIPEEFFALQNFRKRNEDQKFVSIFGLVDASSILSLRKILFRIAKENVIINQVPLTIQKDQLILQQNKDQQGLNEKCALFLLFPNLGQKAIETKFKTILNMFNFQELQIPEHTQRSQIYSDIQSNLIDNRKICVKTKIEIDKILMSFQKPKILQRVSFLNVAKLVINREKNFAKQLIYINEKDGFYELFIWIPKTFENQITREFENINKEDQTFIKPKIFQIKHFEKNINQDKIPTKFQTNIFTKPFQEIVETYGIPKYKEINPGIFTTVTFPFLFAVMFGDVGHGLLLFLFAIYLIFYQQSEVSVLGQIKYLILMMSIFAIFCGFIYNEFFAYPLVLFQSCFNLNNFHQNKNCIYPFGFDWIWRLSQNETAFTNSFKMKFSIVAGVSHMLLGIILKGLNALYFRNYVDFFFEALPQFIFMSVTFGYMVFCIIIKWLTNWNGKDPVSIIQLFINFTNVDQPLFATKQFQQQLQILFIVVCFLCILLMLIPKPFFVHRQNQNLLLLINSKENEFDQVHKLIESVDEQSFENQVHNESFGELLVHQLIETIEFVLGSISNTASYLRLWALSLAHGQLSKVFFDMIIGWAIKDSPGLLTGFLSLSLGFVFFFFVTFAVIMVMDTMECFLHALRLHWVEFQNKFFKGGGKKFQAFEHEIPKIN